MARPARVRAVAAVAGWGAGSEKALSIRAARRKQIPHQLRGARAAAHTWNCPTHACDLGSPRVLCGRCGQASRSKGISTRISVIVIPAGIGTQGWSRRRGSRSLVQDGGSPRCAGKLWEAFERLKTLEPRPNKRMQAERLSDGAATLGARFRQILEKEASALTKITFGGRRSETGQEDLGSPERVDYFFDRLFASPNQPRSAMQAVDNLYRQSSVGLGRR